jgi:hypothetical protein
VPEVSERRERQRKREKRRVPEEFFRGVEPEAGGTYSRPGAK